MEFVGSVNKLLGKSMTKQTILIISVILLSCNERKEVIAKTNINYYDSIEKSLSQKLKTLNLSSFNDSIKWTLYSVYADDSTSWGEQNKGLPNIPLGFLSLKLLSLSQKLDTINLSYSFIYKDSIRVESHSQDRKPVWGEVMMLLDEKKIIGYGTDIFYSIDAENGRFKKPLKDHTIFFIKNNRDKLDPWFREQAKEKDF